MVDKGRVWLRKRENEVRKGWNYKNKGMVLSWELSLDW